MGTSQKTSMKKTLTLLALAIAPTLFAFPTYEPFVSITNSTVGDTNGWSATTSYTNKAQLANQTNGMGEFWFAGSPAATKLPVSITNITLHYTNALGVSQIPSGFPEPNQCAFLPNIGSSSSNGPGATLNFSKVVYPPSNTSTTNKVYVSFLMSLPTANAAGSGIYLMGMVPSGQVTQTFNGSVNGNTARFFWASSNNVNGSNIGTNAFQIGWGDSSGGFGTAAKSTNLLASPIPNNNGYMISNTTYFVVMSYEFGGTNTSNTVTNDWMRLWVDPPTASFGIATPPTELVNHLVPNGGGILTNAAGWFMLARGANSTPTNGVVIGSMRMGTTWAYVTGGPEFTNQPASGTYALGTTVTLSAKAVAGGITMNGYQWQRNGVNLTDSTLPDGAVVSGSQTASLTIAGVTSQDSASYTAIATDAISSITSSPAVITVSDPSISSQPTPQVTYPTGSANFSVTANGSQPVTYQWKMNGANLTDGASPSATGATISGSQSANLTIGNAQIADSGETFTCVVSNVYGASVTSSTVSLTVTDPGVVTPPANTNVNYGQTAKFTVSAAGATGLSYQWQLGANNLSNGASISGSGATVSGATTSALTISGVNYQDAGSYTVLITDTAGSTFKLSSADGE